MDHVPSNENQPRKVVALELTSGEVPMTADDQAVIAALECGNRVGALQVLMRVYGDAVYRYCSAQLRDPSIVADVHQVVFMQAYDSFDRFSRTSSAGKWLFGIAHHRCIDAAREISRRAARVSSGDQLPEESDPRPPCDEELGALELAAMVTECIEKLKPDARTAVLLRYQEGLSYNDIARMCQGSPASLQQRVSRAIQDLRRCLEKKGVLL